MDASDALANGHYCNWFDNSRCFARRGKAIRGMESICIWMIEKIKEWGYAFAVLLALAFLPLTPILFGLLAIYLTIGLEPLGFWSAIGWFILAWLVVMVVDLLIRDVIRSGFFLAAGTIENLVKYKRLEDWMTQCLMLLVYFGLFNLITPATGAVLGTAVSVFVAFVLYKTKLFED